MIDGRELHLRVNLRPLLYKLLRLFFHAAFEGFFLAPACSAAYLRMSSVIFIEQKCGPQQDGADGEGTFSRAE